MFSCRANSGIHPSNRNTICVSEIFENTHGIYKVLSQNEKLVISDQLSLKKKKKKGKFHPLEPYDWEMIV